MSIDTKATTIITDLKSFAAKVEAFIKKMFGDLPTILQIASGTLTYLGPIVVALADEVNPLAGSAISVVLSDIKTKLATAAALVTSSASSTTITEVLKDIADDIPSVLGLLSVSDASLVTKVESWTSVITQEIEALIAGFATATSTTSAS